MSRAARKCQMVPFILVSEDYIEFADGTIVQFIKTHDHRIYAKVASEQKWKVRRSPHHISEREKK